MIKYFSSKRELSAGFVLFFCSLVFIACRKELKPEEAKQELFSSPNKNPSPPVQERTGSTSQNYKPGEIIFIYPPGTDESKKKYYRKQFFANRKIEKIEGCVCDPSIELIKGEGVDSLGLNDPTRTVTSSSYGVQGTGVEVSRNLILKQSNTGYTGQMVPYNYTTHKGNVRVAVIDSGLDLGYFTASSPNNFLLAASIANFRQAGITNPALINKNGYFGWNFIKNDQDFADDNFMKHGTQVTGLILSENTSRAPGIIPLKVFDAGGQATEFSVLCALKFAELAQAKIINASWGYSGEANGALRKAFESLHSKNILVVTSAGNENLQIGSSSGHPYFPACFSNPYDAGLDNVITTTTARVYATSAKPGAGKTGALCGQNYSRDHVDIGVAGKGDDCGILSAFNNSSSNIRLSGSSYATAVLTGIIADKYFTGPARGSLTGIYERKHDFTSGSLKENVLSTVLASVSGTDPVIPGIRTGKRVLQ